MTHTHNYIIFTVAEDYEKNKHCNNELELYYCFSSMHNWSTAIGWR